MVRLKIEDLFRLCFIAAKTSRFCIIEEKTIRLEIKKKTSQRHTLQETLVAKNYMKVSEPRNICITKINNYSTVKLLAGVPPAVF
jgi:hypothetical protein